MRLCTKWCVSKMSLVYFVCKYWSILLFLWNHRRSAPPHPLWVLRHIYQKGWWGKFECGQFVRLWNTAKIKTDVFVPSPFTLSSVLFLCYAKGNVFRPGKSHAGQTTTQQESIDRSDQPNTKNLCLSAAVWKPLPAFRAQWWKLMFLLHVSLGSISHFLPND